MIIIIKNVLLQVSRVGISLIAESTTGAMLSVQTSSAPVGEGQAVVPEDLGKQATEMLLAEIYRVIAIFLFSLWSKFQVGVEISA